MKTTLYNLNKLDRFFFFITLFQIPNWLLRQQRVAINYRYNEIIFTNYGDTVLIYTGHRYNCSYEKLFLL